MEQGLNRNYELQDFGATTDKTAAYGDLIDAKLLLSGEIGIGRGMNGGGIYLKVGTRVIGLQTSEDFTERPYPILVRKLPKGSIVNLIAR